MRHVQKRRVGATGDADGFSLIEVLVALIVLSIGLLGIAKIQALAYSSTGNASYRSIAPIQASSIAAAMHANRAYWAVGAPANASISVAVSGTTATVSGGPGNGTTDCSSTTCTAPQLATYDLQQWALAMSTQPNPVLPNAGNSIRCTNTQPVNCTIQVSWNEKLVAVNKQGSASSGAAAISGTQYYTLYVEP